MSWAEVLGVWTPVNKPAGVSSGGHDRTPWRLVNVEADSPTAQHLGPRKTGVGEEHGRASICAKDPQLQGPQGPLQLPRHGLLRSLVGCLRSLRRGCAWAGKSGTFSRGSVGSPSALWKVLPLSPAWLYTAGSVYTVHTVIHAETVACRGPEPPQPFRPAARGLHREPGGLSM